MDHPVVMSLPCSPKRSLVEEGRYSQDLNLYLGGTINQGASKTKPFRLMRSVIKAIQSKS